MNISRDIIAAVRGPGWRHGLSRILIDENDNGVVFVAGSDEPLATFVVKSVATSSGVGESDEGEITWRRRGSSCQYKLAKCKISTAEMAARWESALSSKASTEDKKAAEVLDKEIEGQTVIDENIETDSVETTEPEVKAEPKKTKKAEPKKAAAEKTEDIGDIL